MARKTAKRSRRGSRRQRGGGFAFDGPAFAAAPGFAPEAARTGYDDCAVLPRPAPQVGGACMSCQAVRDPSSVPPQRGGGGGSGGYSFDLTNDLGKVHAGYTVGACPAPQIGGGEAYPLVSYAAGYGYDASSPYSTPSQSAHFMEPRGYGQQCMGGGSRRRHRTRRHRRSRRHSRK